jgi:hypothetical protein
MGQWAIYRFICECAGGKITKSLDLLKRSLYYREPDRYIDAPLPHQYIFPDKESIDPFIKKIRVAIWEKSEAKRLENLKHSPHEGTGPQGIDLNDLPF